jgi:hypothetical protein
MLIGEAVADVMIFGEEVGGFLDAAADDIKDRPGQLRRCVLGDVSDTHSLRLDEVAAIGTLFTGEKFEHARLAAAVAAKETEAIAGFDGEVDAIEEGGATKGEGDVTQRDQGHGDSQNEG